MSYPPVYPSVRMCRASVRALRSPSTQQARVHRRTGPPACGSGPSRLGEDARLQQLRHLTITHLQLADDETLAVTLLVKFEHLLISRDLPGPPVGRPFRLLERANAGGGIVGSSCGLAVEMAPAEDGASGSAVSAGEARNADSAPSTSGSSLTPRL